MTGVREYRGIPTSVAVAISELQEYLIANLGTSFAAGNVIVRNPIKTFPGIPLLFLDNADVEEFGDDAIGEGGTTTDSFSVAIPKNGWRIKENYKSPDFDQGPQEGLPENNNQDLPPLPTDTFLTVSTSLGMEILATDKSGLEWALANAAGNKQLGVNTTIAEFVPTETLNLSWHRVRFPPWTNIRALRGKLNQATFLGHEAETVMFLGLDASREYQINAVRQWRLDYKFAIKEVKFEDPAFPGQFITAGWNHFLRPDADATSPDTWQIILRKAGVANRIYLTDDLTGLFVPEQQ